MGIFVIAPSFLNLGPLHELRPSSTANHVLSHLLAISSTRCSPSSIQGPSLIMSRSYRHQSLRAWQATLQGGQLQRPNPPARHFFFVSGPYVWSLPSCLGILPTSPSLINCHHQHQYIAIAYEACFLVTSLVLPLASLCYDHR